MKLKLSYAHARLFKIHKICGTIILSCTVILAACNNDVGTTETSAVKTKSEQTSHLGSLDNYVPDEIATLDEPQAYTPLAEYAYVAAGNYIEMYKIESSGNMLSIGSITPAGMPSTAKFSSIAISPNHLNVYATIQNGTNDDKIWALGLNAATGKLAPLAKQLVSTKKSATSSITVSRNSMFVYTANSTQICTYQIQDNYGTLPDTPTSCISPLVNGTQYPYGQIKLSANGKYAFVSSGPSLNTIVTLKRESNGTLSYLSLLDTKVNNNLSMAIPESGGFMYTALKGNYAVGQYQIDSSTGKISPLSPQSEKSGSSSAEPHAVVLTPNRRYAYVSNYHDNTIAIFNVNESGTLQKSPRSVTANGNPDKITMDKSGSFIYVSTKDKHILQYAIDHATGDLTQLANPALTIWESGANIAITDIEGLHMSLISPVYTHDIPLDSKYVVDFSNGYTESSIRTTGNIIACQIEESKYNPESMVEVSAASVSSASCPSGSSAVMVGDIFDLSPTQIAIGFVGLLAAHQVMIFLSNIKDAFGNTYPDREIVVDTTVPYNMMTSPESGAKNVSTHSYLYFTFTENIKPDSPHNKVTITYLGNSGGKMTANLPTRAQGTNIAAGPGGLPVGSIDATAEVELVSGSVATATGTATIIEESQESKLIIYVAYGEDKLGYTGNLAPYDTEGNDSGIDGANAECNAVYNKPTNRSNKHFKPLLKSYDYYVDNEAYLHHPLQHELPANTPYYNIEEGYITTSSDQGTFNNPEFDHPIGVQIPNHLTTVWTGMEVDTDDHNSTAFYYTAPQWYASLRNCDKWSSGHLRRKGAYGNSMAINLSAIGVANPFVIDGSGDCDELKGIYCVQQPD